MLATQPQTLRTHVEHLLQSNLRQGHDRVSGVDYSYLSPSTREHQWQWFTHSCFHAIAIAHVDPELAQRELQTLIAGKADDGFIGYVHFWGMRWAGIKRPWAYLQAPAGERLTQSTLIRPPMLAQAVERVAQITHDAAFAPPLMQALDDYHDWLASNRVPGDDRLMVIVSPHESGMERSPTYDRALGLDRTAGRWLRGWRDRGIDTRHQLAHYDSKRMLSDSRFYVKDAVVNALYADSLATMARLHRAQGSPDVAAAYAESAAIVSESIMTKMLDRAKGGFFSLVGADELRSEPRTVGGLVPLILEGVPAAVAEEIVEHHLRSAREFWLRYPIPSVAANEDTFTPREERLPWRGPTWVYANWLVWRGLRLHGFNELAEQIASRTIGMVAEAGLWEFYNPLTGEGMGKKDFGWSALALDMTSAS